MIVNRPVIIQSNVDFAKKADVEGSTSIPATVNFIRTVGHETQGDFGGALYKRASSAADITDGSGGFWDRREPVVTPQMCGTGVGAGVAEADSAAMQLAVDSGYPVFLPRLSVPYKFADVTLPNACAIFGETFGLPGGYLASAANYLINGDGSAPIFKVGTYGSGVTSARYVRIQGISAYNDGDTVLQLHNTPDFRVLDNIFHSVNLTADEAAVDIKFSVRGHLTGNRITASGTDCWAIQGIDNCNAGVWSGNVASGGTAGGAVNIGQCQNMDLRSTVIESSLIGFQIASDSGLCSAIDLSGFYIEQCRDPFLLGLTFALRGCIANGGYVGNGETTVIADRNACFQIGRVQGLIAKGGFFTGEGSEAFLKFFVNASAPTEMEQSEIIPAYRTGYASDITWDAGAATANKVRVMGRNNIDLMRETVTGRVKEWISDTITCNVGMTQKGVVVPTTNGGQVVSVEIVEASGSLDGTLAVGSVSSATEVCNQDLSALSLTNNTSPVTLATQLLRPAAALLVRHTAGAATTTFRVKITYRN